MERRTGSSSVTSFLLSPPDRDEEVKQAMAQITQQLKVIVQIRYASIADNDQDGDIKDKLSSLDYQAVTKAYNDARASVRDFVDDSRDAVSRDYREKVVWGQTWWFLVKVVFLSLLTVGVAVFFAFLGGKESPFVTKLTLEGFVGWPDGGNTFMKAKTLYCGLMLGLVFGFLDNFGLFFGMATLDAWFYKFASGIISGIVYHYRTDLRRDGSDTFIPTIQPQALLEVNVVANDLMAGLGNTFSDLVGVLVGTAALEIAKAGLGVTPNFWPLDVIAMALGCLLGAFLPAVMKHAEMLGGVDYSMRLYSGAQATIALLVLSVIFAGLPEKKTESVGDWSFWVSLVLMMIPIFVLLFLLSFRNKGLERAKEWRASFYSQVTGNTSNDFFNEDDNRTAQAQGKQEVNVSARRTFAVPMLRFS